MKNSENPVPLTGEEYKPLFKEQLLKLRSGFVPLKKGEDCGEHTTGEHEELLIMLEGEGTVKLVEENLEFSVKAGQAFYVKPGCRHNVTGNETGLKYVYIVTPV